MRIAVLMPTTFTDRVLRRVLDSQPDMDVAGSSFADCDVALVHSSLVDEGAGIITGLVAAGRHVIVTASTPDPSTLAGYLAAGARGYHRAGESLPRLLDLIRGVHAGELRYDPYVMEHLLRSYRHLRRSTSDATTGVESAARMRGNG